MRKKSANLFNVDSAISGIIDTEGNITSNSSYKTSDYISVTPENIIKAFYLSNGIVYPANMSRLAAFDENKNVVVSAGSASAINTYTIPSGVYYIRFSSANGVLNSEYMIISGNDTPSSYIPYVDYFVATEDFVEEAVGGRIKQIEDDIDLTKAYMDLKQSANVLDKSTITTGVKINKNGILSPNNQSSTSDYIPVTSEDVLKAYYIVNDNVINSNILSVACYDEGKNLISNAGTDTSSQTFIVPSGVYFVRLSWSTGLGDTYMIIVNQQDAPSKYIPYEQGYVAKVDFIVDVLKEKNVLQGTISKEETDFWTLDKSANLFDKNNVVDGEYFNTNGTIRTSGAMSRSFVHVFESGDYAFKVAGDFYGLANACKIPLFDKDKIYVKTIIATTSETTASAGNIVYLTISEQDIIDGAYYIGYSLHTNNKDSFMFIEGSSYPNTYIAFRQNWRLPDLTIDAAINPLFDKKVVFDGDSICAGNGSEMGHYGRGWAGRIGVDNNMEWYNVGVSGACVTAETYFLNNTPRHWVSRYIDTIYTDYPDLDYLIGEGGTNDADNFYSTPEKLGTFSETDFTGPFDDTTFYGAMDSWCKKALTYFPKAKIGFIIAHKMGTNFVTYVKNRYDYFTYAEKVCKKWGIPVINLWETGQLRPDVESNYNPIYNTIETATEHGYLYYDGQHLTAYGYDLISPKIEAWMKSL